MIDLQRDGSVFVLRMHDGENRINRSFLDEFDRALDEVEASSGEAALVTTGEERFYSTGLDLEWLAGRSEEEIQALLSDLDRLFARMLVFPTATVAAINGHAFAAGAMLSVAHDFRVMRADRGFFCLPEIDLATGRPLTPGMYAVLKAKLPSQSLLEALVTGKRYGGFEAAARQFVHETQDENDVLPRAIDIARGLAGEDRATMAAIKRGLFASELEVLGSSG